MTQEKIIELYGTIEFYNKVMAEQYLQDTDYIANKMVEYQFLGKELDKDYTETLKKREEAREVIRNYGK
mgnify:CR=1 FL=1